jgi:pyruvate,water dikinase
LNYLFDEHDEAVKIAIRQIIERAQSKKRSVGFCGQVPSDDPSYAAYLVECGINSISVNPDSVVAVLKSVHKAEIQKKSHIPV